MEPVSELKKESQGDELRRSEGESFPPDYYLKELKAWAEAYYPEAYAADRSFAAMI